jgi:hypothetical protein
VASSAGLDAWPSPRHDGADWEDTRSDNHMAIDTACGRIPSQTTFDVAIISDSLTDQARRGSDRHVPGHASSLLSLELLNAERMIKVVIALKLPVRTTGLADTCTLIIPVAPTILFEAGARTRKATDTSDGMLRLSAGIEDIDELITGFSQALQLAAWRSYPGGCERDWRAGLARPAPGCAVADTRNGLCVRRTCRSEVTLADLDNEWCGYVDRT